MPRVADLPPLEREICQRLRAFRESTRVPRTVFAAEAGIIGARLINCELSVTPLSYGLFKAINAKYLVSAKWLVTGKDSTKWGHPFDDSVLSSKPGDRELLSSAYNRFLKPEYERQAADATHFMLGPGGVKSKMDDFTRALNDPVLRKHIPDSDVLKILRFLEKMVADIDARLAGDAAINESSNARRRRKTKG